MGELTQISVDLVCSSEFLIQVCRKLPMSSQLQLTSRAPRSLDLLLRPPIQPERCDLNLKVILKWRDIYIENIRLVSLRPGHLYGQSLN